jgi:elongation factor Ts
MHIAALNPVVTFPEQLDPALVAAERDRLRSEALASGKKENMVDKIVEGQLKRWFGEQNVLVMQPFAKDDKKIVGDALAEGGLQAVSYLRWKVGASA